MSVIALKLQETTPPAILLEAITDQLFELLRMKKYPIQIMKWRDDEDCTGRCFQEGSTENLEIQMAVELFEYPSHRLKESQIQIIKATYIHECAHRLTPGHPHDGAFLALNFMLHLRAGEGLAHHVSVYDFHEEDNFARSFAWAYTLALELSKTALTAEECAEIIMTKYRLWTESIKNEPSEKKRSEIMASKQKKAAAADRARLIHKIKTLKSDLNIAIFFALITNLIMFNLR